MPWRCPACHIQIRHSEAEDRPRFGTRYRCHVCRLELVFDPDSDRLIVAPLPDDDANRKNRRTD
jgi:rubredoxin